MIHIIKTTILRNQLKSGKYKPEILNIIKTTPFDLESRKEYYKPSVNLLNEMYNLK